MASAGSLFYDLIPKIDASALAAEAKKGGVAAGSVMGTTLGEAAGRAAAPALANSGRSMEQAAGDLGTRVGSIIGRSFAPALAPVGTAITWAQGQFRRLPPVVQDTLGSVPRIAAEAFGFLQSSVADATEKTESAFSGMGEKIKGALESMKEGLADLGINAGLALSAMVTGAITLGVQFDIVKENATVAFTTMLGSAEKAQNMIATLVDFAKTTPFDFPGLVESAQHLMAFGFSANQVIPTLTAIGDAVAGLGGSAAEVDRVTTALGQMMAKGKVQGDEILQLTEAGIPALRILANEYGVTTATMSAMITKGQVAADKAIPALLAGIEKGTKGAAGQTQAFAGMMAAQATTLTGVWSNFTDSFQSAMGGLVAPVIPLVKDGMLQLTTLFMGIPDALAFIGNAFAPVMANLSSAFNDLKVALGPVIDIFLKPLAQVIGIMLVVAWRAFIDVLTIASSVFAGVANFLKEHQFILILVVTAVGAYTAAVLAQSAVTLAFLALTVPLRLAMIAATAAQWAWNIAMTANPIGLVVAAIALLVAGLIYAWNNSETFRTVVTAAWEGIKSVVGTVWDFLVSVYQGFVAKAQAAGSAFASIWDNVVGVVTTAVDGVTTAVSAVGSFFASAWGVVIDVFTAVGNAATWFYENGIKPAFEGIVTTAKYIIAILFTILVAPFLILFNLLKEPAIAFWHGTIEPMVIGVIAAFQFLVAGSIAIWNGLVSFIQSTLVAPFLYFWHGVVEPFAAGVVAANAALWVAVQIAWVAVQAWIQTYLVIPFQAFLTFIQFLWTTFQAANAAAWLAIQLIWAQITLWIQTWIVLPFQNFLIWIQGQWLIFQTANAALWAAIVAVWAQITLWIDTYITQPFMTLWNGVIVPVWAGIQAAIETAWNYIRDNIFTPLGNFVTVTIPSWFSAAAAAIASTWNTIREACAAPIRWVIDAVWNNGIVAAWNAIAGMIGLGTLPTVGVNFARGGIVPGVDTGQDYVPALLRGGEGVLVPEATRMLGGESGIYAINRQAERSGFARGGVVQRFADGGVVGALSAVFGSVASALSAFTGGWDVGGWVRDQLSGALNAVESGFGKTWYADQVATAGKQTVDAAINKLIQLVSDWWNSVAGYLQSLLLPVANAVGGGLAAVASRLGLTGNAAMDWIIAHESGGRNVPNASGASTASGYFQMINGTWRAYGGSTARAMDASYAEQAAVATNYVNARYGGWGGAQAYWQSHGNYDQGGVLPVGSTLAYNGTGRPELILTQEQAAALGSGSSLIGSLAIQVPERATARDVVDELSFALRHARHGGLHARRYG